MSPSSTLAERIDATAWIDTHEHLVEERHRLGEEPVSFTTELGEAVSIPPDWIALIGHYALDDLVTAGLPAAAARDLRAPGLSPVQKWDIVAPFMAAARATGYLRAVDLTTERLFGLRLTRETCDEIDRRARELRRPGYYKHVLRDVANVERCHVHSLETDPFCETESPDVLDGDLSLVPLVLGRHPRAERLAGIEVGTLEDYVEVLEWCFAQYAHRAVAAKCLWAYARPLAVDPVDAPPRRAFERLRHGSADLAERRQVENHLLTHCLRLATEHGLPVKIHMGYLAGTRDPRANLIDRHVPDMAALVHAHPRTRFVLMHMAWPHQEQLLAVAKHHPNVVVDLCWSWIVTPLSTREFVRRFLTTVPATKLLCFGGDYMTVECVVGHAEIARRGLQAALQSLVDEDWLTAEAALDLVVPLMRGNAEQLFPHV